MILVLKNRAGQLPGSTKKQVLELTFKKVTPVVNQRISLLTAELKAHRRFHPEVLSLKNEIDRFFKGELTKDGMKNLKKRINVFKENWPLLRDKTQGDFEFYNGRLEKINEFLVTSILVIQIQEDLKCLKDELSTFRCPSGPYECFEYNNAQYLLKEIFINIARLNSSDHRDLVEIKFASIDLARKYFCLKYFGEIHKKDAAIEYIRNFLGTDLGSLTKSEYDQRVDKLKEILDGQTGTSTEAKPITYQNPATQWNIFQAIRAFFESLITSFIAPRSGCGLFASKNTTNIFPHQLKPPLQSPLS